MNLASNKYYLLALIIVYLFTVYGSVIIFNLELISRSTWNDIHYIGIATTLTMVTLLARKKIPCLLSSFLMAIFPSRLITELSSDTEYKWEMISILILTVGVYYLEKKWR